ncbi:MAG: type II secretion system F family protein [Armatimonadetes bacterium]|nr:type II secretion system F family protein [Armatimonadota bacterium]
MPNFNYVAVDPTGHQVTGEIQAADIREVTQRLRDAGSFPVEVNEAREGARKKADKASPAPAARRRGKVGRGDVAVLTRQLSDLIAAGMPLDRALTVLIEQSENAALQDLLAQTLQEVRGGEALSEAFSKYPRVFSPMYTNMFKAGEASGQLGEVSQRLADFLEREQVRRSQIITALTYPAVILSVSLLAVVFLLTVVVPKLSGVFSDLGSALPLPTVILLALTGFLSQFWWALLILIVAGFFGFRAYAGTPAGRKQVDSVMMRLPLVGRLVSKVVISRFARAFGTLVTGGVSLLEALEIAGDASGNSAFRENTDSLIESARQGESLANGMAKAGRFPPVLIHMTAVGEETGNLPLMLNRVSDSLDFEVDSAMRRLTTMLEPLIVVSVGGFVGFVVLSILLPIFEANSAVK